ncbi:MAG: hypothetical protein K0S30_2495 [Clostridia bacterium]|jgi:spore coat protein JB|nr:hypothetical protein [Clostridia bacterium]MDF2879399.1 hypothetical protein [Clostridia bacterium]
MMRNDREELLMYITTTSFAVDDVNLYLDTHPTDQAALEYYQKCNELRKQAVKQYTDYFGPLTANNVNVTNVWTWIDEPWPWEMGR